MPAQWICASVDLWAQRTHPRRASQDRNLVTLARSGPSLALPRDALEQPLHRAITQAGFLGDLRPA
jgi:hypothetical protein